MKVLYKDKSLEKLCNNEKEAYRKLGKIVAEKLFATIVLLESANNLKDILCLTQYRLHALKANLDGYYSMYLGKNTGFV